MAPEAHATIEQALRAAKGLGVDRLDAQVLLGHALGQGRTWVIAHSEYVLTNEEFSTWSTLVARRAAGVPVSYLVGWREFHGLSLRVTPAVLDPRPDTETLVDWGLELLAQGRFGPRPQVLDLGTGSGAIALAVKSAYPRCEVHASDASKAALAVAQDNAQRLGLAVSFHAGSWWSAVPGLQVHLALSNPPYIGGDDPHLEALTHEPHAALVADENGLADLRALIQGAVDHLQDGGWLLMEHGHTQAEAVAAMMRDAGFGQIGHRQDLAGHTRCTGGRLTG